MGLSMSDLVAGDHIYTWRAFSFYAHHGIYIGDNRVVHFNSQKLTGSFSSRPSSAPARVCNSLSRPHYCGFRRQGSGVTVSCLNCFLRNDSLHRFKYGVTRREFKRRIRGGTCTTAESDPPETVIHRATYLLDNGFGDYDLYENNCEDFALYCKTGLVVENKDQVPGGGQASSFLVTLDAVLDFEWFDVGDRRYAADIGVRRDAVRVGVENLATFRGN